MFSGFEVIVQTLIGSRISENSGAGEKKLSGTCLFECEGGDLGVTTNIHHQVYQGRSNRTAGIQSLNTRGGGGVNVESEDDEEGAFLFSGQLRRMGL